MTYSQAIAEATIQAMEMDDSVFVIAQGTRGSGYIFGSLEGVFEKMGEKRVMEMPISESAIAGICVGAAINQLRPILVLQRADFAFLILDQIINHASKYHFMFGGQVKIPLTIRLIVGKGWGQGPQHSQSLHSLFAHFPGLRVVAPTDAYTMKGSLLNAVFLDDPVIIFEGRSLYSHQQMIPKKPYVMPLGQARKITDGDDLTVVAVSFLMPETLSAVEQLKTQGLSIELIDLISINPLDIETIAASVKKTGRLLIVDTSWAFCGISAEISAQINELLFGKLKTAIRRITITASPTPTAAALEQQFYPNSKTIMAACQELIRKGETVHV